MLGMASDWLETKEFQDMTQDVMRMLSHYLGNKTFFISHITPKRFIVIKSQRGSLELDKGLKLPLNQSICSHIAQKTRKTLVIPDATKHVLTMNSPISRNLKLGSYLGVPLILKNGDFFGTLCVLDSQPYEFTFRDIDTVETLSRLITASIELHKNAVVDHLTGLYNKKYLDQKLERIAHDETKEVCTAILFDVDDFKKINDSLGHGTGDHVLSYIGELVRNSMPDEVIPYRFGGDEFCIIAPGYTGEEMLEYVHRLQALTALYPLTKVSLSIGISDTLVSGRDELIDTADVALYDSKKNGKDRYTVFQNAEEIDFTLLAVT